MVDFRSEGRAEYRVDWTSSGYEKLIQEFRDFLRAKRDVDSAMRSGMAAPSGLVGAGGHPVRSSAAADADRVQREYARSVAEAGRAHRDYAQSMRGHQRLTERAERDRARAVQQEADQSFRQRLQAQQRERARQDALPRVLQSFAKVTPEGGLTFSEMPSSEKGWRQLGQRMSLAVEESLKRGEQTSKGDQELLGRVARITGMQQARERTGFLGRAINAVGWMPGVPQEVYLAQMALGEMGLGLGPIGVAAGLGVGALAGAGLGIYNVQASQNALGRSLASLQPGNAGAIIGDRTLANQLAQVGQGFGLSLTDMDKLLPALDQFNLAGMGNFQNIPALMQQGLVRASQGQLTNEQGISLQALVTSRMGGDVQQASRAFAQLDQAILATGANVHDVYQSILQEGDALKAGTDLTQFAALSAALEGTGVQASQVVGGAIGSTGLGRLQQAAVLGMSEAQFTAMQQNPAQMATALQGFARAKLAQTGSRSATEAIMENLGFIQPGGNEDMVLSQMLAGQFDKAAAAAAPSKQLTTQQLDQMIQTATVQQMDVQNLTLPWQTRLGNQLLAPAAQDIANAARTPGPSALNLAGVAGAAAASAGQDIQQHPGLAVLPGGFGSAMAFGAEMVRHLVEIVVRDQSGRVISTTTADLTGSSTQTPTPTPGQGPTRNVGITPPNTPNRTNANGRVPVATPTP